MRTRLSMRPHSGGAKRGDEEGNIRKQTKTVGDGNTVLRVFREGRGYITRGRGKERCDDEGKARPCRVAPATTRRQGRWVMGVGGRRAQPTQSVVMGGGRGVTEWCAPSERVYVFWRHGWREERAGKPILLMSKQDDGLVPRRLYKKGRQSQSICVCICRERMAVVGETRGERGVIKWQAERGQWR